MFFALTSKPTCSRTNLWARSVPFLCAAALLVTPAFAAETPQQLLAKADVKAAMDSIQSNEAHFVEEQIRVCEIASTFDSQSVQTIFCNWSQA